MKRFLFLFLLVPFSSIAQQGKQRTMSLDSLFQSYFKAGEPGGAVLLVKDNKVIYQKVLGLPTFRQKNLLLRKHFSMSAPSAKHL